MIGQVIGSTLLVVIALVLLALALSTLVVATYAWWDPTSRSRTAYPAVVGADELSFSLIMPCRHEVEAVMRPTLDALLSQSHARVEVVISVGHDDPETIATARRLAAENPGRVRVSVDTSLVKNKPRQLNTALAVCRNEIVGVFDAESIAAPNLLSNIDNAFRTSGADAVQGAVQLVNFRDSWFSLRNCLEYFVWFSSRLHLQEDLGFIPLGGNTVFVRRTVLEQMGGWDEDCLAEDCEIGVRLSSSGNPIRVVYSAELATREETPDTVTALVKQRTRWALGFFQVFHKGLWRQLPTRRERLAARWTLTQQHLVALTGVAIPTSIALAIGGNFPLPVTMITFLPLVATIATVTLEACMLREFGHDHGFRIRVRDYVVLVLGTLPYQLLLAFATMRAYVKFRTGDLRWEKTSHAGNHLAYLGAEASS